MKTHTETIEGPEAWTRFDALVTAVMKVPHSVIVEREAEYKRQAALNPKRRGPKRKPKPSTSDHAEATN